MNEAISNTNLTQTVALERSNIQSETKVQKPVVVEAVKVERTIEQQTEKLAQQREIKKELQEVEEQKAIQEVASKLQEFVNLIDKKLQFSVDENSGRHIITVSDKLSGDVIRQIPSEEVLRLAQNLSELAETANRSGKLITTEV
ncbi:MAG: flagellar protein FlaG [Gammaproteobacteria bacterium]|nr:flagellar protein FlaG [Gammaproteobacteria bacterium]